MSSADIHAGIVSITSRIAELDRAIGALSARLEDKHQASNRFEQTMGQYMERLAANQNRADAIGGHAGENKLAKSFYERISADINPSERAKKGGTLEAMHRDIKREIRRDEEQLESLRQERRRLQAQLQSLQAEYQGALEQEARDAERANPSNNKK